MTSGSTLFPFANSLHATVTLLIFRTNRPWYKGRIAAVHSSGAQPLTRRGLRRAPLLCGLVLFLLVGDNKAAYISFIHFHMAFYLFLLHLGQMPGFLGRTAGVRHLHRKALTGTRAEVGEVTAPPFMNLLDTYTHVHTHAQMF